MEEYLTHHNLLHQIDKTEYNLMIEKYHLESIFKRIKDTKQSLFFKIPFCLVLTPINIYFTISIIKSVLGLVNGNNSQTLNNTTVVIFYPLLDAFILVFNIIIIKGIFTELGYFFGKKPKEHNYQACNYEQEMKITQNKIRCYESELKELKNSLKQYESEHDTSDWNQLTNNTNPDISRENIAKRLDTALLDSAICKYNEHLDQIITNLNSGIYFRDSVNYREKIKENNKIISIFSREKRIIKENFDAFKSVIFGLSFIIATLILFFFVFKGIYKLELTILFSIFLVICIGGIYYKHNLKSVIYPYLIEYKHYSYKSLAEQYSVTYYQGEIERLQKENAKMEERLEYIEYYLSLK